MNSVKVYSPYNGELLGELPRSSAAQVSQAIERAYQYFRRPQDWMAANERIAILERSAVLLEQRSEELLRCAASEGGKPYNDSKIEVQRAINGLKTAVQALLSFGGEQVPMGLTPASIGRLAFTQFEPIGPVASISAFNHPVNLAVHQTAPAIAVGAPFIIKPATATPLSCFKLLEIYKEAGLPADMGTAMVMDRKAAGLLASDRRIHYLSFIGSGEVGWKLRSQLAPGTRCSLEHGGVAPVLVFGDADLSAMLPDLLKGGFYHAGQVCVSVQCVHAPRTIAKDLAQRLATGARELRVGDPLDPQTEVGPIISPEELERIHQWVQEAQAAGAELLCGGKMHSKSCYQPTVLFNAPSTAKVSQHEVFGPVVSVYPYDDPELALEQINNLPYGFQASIYTQDIDRALSFGQRINASSVMINDHTAFRTDWMPFGGRDESGLGLGGIPYTMREMSREKLMVLRSKQI